MSTLAEAIMLLARSNACCCDCPHDHGVFFSIIACRGVLECWTVSHKFDIIIY